MQTSLYKTNEAVYRQEWRAQPISLEEDYSFADEVLGEKQRLSPDDNPEKVWSFWHGLLHGLADRQWVFAVWIIEALWIVFAVMANSMEMWGSCPAEMGIVPVCRYCYSGAFLAWNSVLVVLWILHLYLSVLLVSRGFRIPTTRILDFFYENKGVPVNALYAFLFFTGCLALWMLVGISILIGSNTCARDPHIYVHHDRSGLMFWTTLISVFLAPATISVGRLG